MTKADIVNEISKKTGIDKATVLTTVEAFMESVKESLINDENVYLRGFGSFILKRRAEKTARNISKNTTIIIPAHNIPAFKPAKTFNLSVKKQYKIIHKSLTLKTGTMPSGKKKKRHKMSTHKRKKRLRKNRHKSK